MMRLMVLGRHFSNRLYEMGIKRLFRGTCHTSAGQEAVVVGVSQALGREDHFTTHHRAHFHSIARGTNPKYVFAEVLGKATGVCKGKGGSMHITDASVGGLGGASNIASSVPVAVGAALAAKIKKNNQVTVAYFGDGATCEGALHESMNLAALWKLPVIFVCENNGYILSIPNSKAIPIERIAMRGSAYNMPSSTVDGQDVLEVHRVMAQAVTAAREGQGPSLIEAVTYRYHEHSSLAPSFGLSFNRPAEEIEQWKRRDPIEIHKRRLFQADLLTPESFETLEMQINQQLDDAIKFAEDSPYPELNALHEDLYSEPQ